MYNNLLLNFLLVNYSKLINLVYNRKILAKFIETKDPKTGYINAKK